MTRGSKIDQTKLVTLEIEYVKDVDPDIVSVARNRFVVGWDAGVLLLPV